jgi:hypothetical protein
MIAVLSTKLQEGALGLLLDLDACFDEFASYLDGSIGNFKY